MKRGQSRPCMFGTFLRFVDVTYITILLATFKHVLMSSNVKKKSYPGPRRIERRSKPQLISESNFVSQV
jgi:hypothetical protein